MREMSCESLPLKGMGRNSKRHMPKGVTPQSQNSVPPTFVLEIIGTTVGFQNKDLKEGTALGVKPFLHNRDPRTLRIFRVSMYAVHNTYE